jgi:hypothetical protein
MSLRVWESGSPFPRLSDSQTLLETALDRELNGECG